MYIYYYYYYCISRHVIMIIINNNIILCFRRTITCVAKKHTCPWKCTRAWITRSHTIDLLWSRFSVMCMQQVTTYKRVGTWWAHICILVCVVVMNLDELPKVGFWSLQMSMWRVGKFFEAARSLGRDCRVQIISGIRCYALEQKNFHTSRCFEIYIDGPVSCSGVER